MISAYSVSFLHSDVHQYTSDEYQQALATLNSTCSLSRTGCCYDNAVIERFFWSFKHEWTESESFDDIDDAQLSVFKYIETFYNSQRIHRTLGYKSPNQFEHEQTELAAQSTIPESTSHGLSHHLGILASLDSQTHTGDLHPINSRPCRAYPIGERELARLSLFQRRYLRLRFFGFGGCACWSANPVTSAVRPIYYD